MNQIKYKLFFVAVFAALSILTSCGSSKSEKVTEKKNTSTDTTEQKSADQAELTAKQMKAVDIQLGTIEQKNLTSVVKASGQLTVPPESKALVNALVGGVIRKINVVEGQAVRKGQVV